MKEFDLVVAFVFVGFEKELVASRLLPYFVEELSKNVKLCTKKGKDLDPRRIQVKNRVVRPGSDPDEQIIDDMAKLNPIVVANNYSVLARSVAERIQVKATGYGFHPGHIFYLTGHGLDSNVAIVDCQSRHQPLMTT